MTATAAPTVLQVIVAAPWPAIGQRVRVTAGGYSDEEGEIVAVNPDGTYDVTTDALWTLRRYPGRSLAPVGKA
jgi:hypothetical protein